MGYNPYNLLIAQQFPWCGTLRLRGQAAEKDVEVALAELAAAELTVVANVKRAYYDLYFNEQAAKILGDNRKLAVDFITIAKARYATGNTGQQDVLRAEVVVTDLDRELLRVSQGLATARADLAQQAHMNPESDLRTLASMPINGVPAEVERLYRLAVATRPELKGRLAAIARDERAVELARKRYYPNVTLGLSYMDMEKTNAVTPKTASGMPNVGLFVGFNLPVYQKKLAAGVCGGRGPRHRRCEALRCRAGLDVPRDQGSVDAGEDSARHHRAVPCEHPAQERAGAGGGDERLPGRQRGLRDPDYGLA